MRRWERALRSAPQQANRVSSFTFHPLTAGMSVPALHPARGMRRGETTGSIFAARGALTLSHSLASLFGQQRRQRPPASVKAHRVGLYFLS